jgi:hypothetical protein
MSGSTPRNGQATVYDRRTKATLLFGGRTNPTYFNDF